MIRMHHRVLATVGAAGLAVATLGVTGTAHAATPPNPYVNHDNGHVSTYQLVTADQTWPEARDAAAAMAAPAGCSNHLVVITSQAEESYIEQSFPYPAYNTNSAWLGAERADSNDQGRDSDGNPASGDFAWITGEPFIYTNWNGNEPNNTFPGEPFMQVAIDFRWNDIFADATSPTSLVETECTPSGLQVTEIDPTSGPAAGGNTVTVYGSGFTGAGAKTVYFGSKKATIVSVDSDFKITVVAPAYPKRLKPGASKTVDVQVKVKNKKSAKTTVDQYTYTAESNNT